MTVWMRTHPVPGMLPLTLAFRCPTLSLRLPSLTSLQSQECVTVHLHFCPVTDTLPVAFHSCPALTPLFCPTPTPPSCLARTLLVPSARLCAHTDPRCQAPCPSSSILVVPSNQLFVLLSCALLSALH